MVSDVDLHNTASTASFYLLVLFLMLFIWFFSAMRVEQTGIGESSTVFQTVVPALYLQVFWLVYFSSEQYYSSCAYIKKVKIRVHSRP